MDYTSVLYIILEICYVYTKHILLCCFCNYKTITRLLKKEVALSVQ